MGMRGGAVFHIRSISTGSGVGLVDEFVELPLQVEGFHGAGAGGAEERQKFGKQTAEMGVGIEFSIIVCLCWLVKKVLEGIEREMIHMPWKHSWLVTERENHGSRQ